MIMAPGWLRRYRWFVIAGVAGVVALIIVVLTSEGGRQLPPPRARVYSAASACLLTGPAGLAGEGVGPVWAGMEDASLVTRTKVSYLAVAGPATTANALPYLGSLELRGCGIILAVGEPQTGAVAVGSRSFPKVRYVVIGTGIAAGNVTLITASDVKSIRSLVADQVESATRLVTDRTIAALLPVPWVVTGRGGWVGSRRG